MFRTYFAVFFGTVLLRCTVDRRHDLPDWMVCTCIPLYVFVAIAFHLRSRRSVPHRAGLGGAPHTWVVRSPLCWDGLCQPRHPVETLHAGPLQRAVLEDPGGVVDRVVRPDGATRGVPSRD